jgi:ubiquinone/menaquinone biosynthesis C-methylase UbiE
MRPTSLEGDWNRLYTEFPEVYDRWACIRHEPEPVNVIVASWPLAGATVIDVGAGSGMSSFEFAAHAAEVVGIEPNPAMRAVAERHKAAGGVRNVSFLAGSAVPCRVRTDPRTS